MAAALVSRVARTSGTICSRTWRPLGRDETPVCTTFNRRSDASVMCSRMLLRQSYGISPVFAVPSAVVSLVLVQVGGPVACVSARWPALCRHSASGVPSSDIISASLSSRVADCRIREFPTLLIAASCIFFLSVSVWLLGGLTCTTTTTQFGFTTYA